MRPTKLCAKKMYISYVKHTIREVCPFRFPSQVVVAVVQEAVAVLAQLKEAQPLHHDVWHLSLGTAAQHGGAGCGGVGGGRGGRLD